MVTFLAALLLQIYAPDTTGTAISLPVGDAVYREETDTYYLIFKFQGTPPYSWDHAQFTVKGYRYKGREGFLARVPDVQTHYFLIGHLPELRQNSAWIALGVYCDAGVAVPVWDGPESPLSKQSFRAWGPKAGEAARAYCKDKSTELIAPGYYTPTDLGSRWEIGQPTMNQDFILVEYPPLSESGDSAE